MVPTIYTWNLTDSGKDRIQLAPSEFNGAVEPIENLDKLDGSDPLVLYIVGHAVPNGLLTGPNNTILKEADLKRALLAVRRSSPTLVVVDTCFAETLGRIDGVEWPENFSFIFSCQKHERTWHSGGTERRSLFSSALNAVLKANEGGSLSWGQLQDALQAIFEELQTPVVSARDGSTPVTFGFPPPVAPSSPGPTPASPAGANRPAIPGETTMMK